MTNQNKNLTLNIDTNKSKEAINIKSNDKIKAAHREENPSSVPKAKVFQEAAKNGFNDLQLNQNLKNYYDCNLDGMSYNEGLDDNSKHQ